MLVAPAGAVTVDGTPRSELLLDKLTATPPPGAAPLSVAVHGIWIHPVAEPLLHERPLSVDALAVVAPNMVTGNPHSNNVRTIAAHRPMRLVSPRPYNK